MKFFKYLLFFIYFSGCLLVFPGNAFSSEDNRVAIVVSKKIRPYMNVVEGIKEGLGKKLTPPQVFFLSDSNLQDDNQVALKLEKGQFDLFTAIGPEAVKLVWGIKTQHPRLFTAVLDPGRLLIKENFYCGISLRIPVERQIQEISEAFGSLKRIGLLFDAGNNEWFYEKARLASKQYAITIVPLKVESKHQIHQALTENWKNIDCIWMIPDKTVISEKIIQYIIKQGLYNKKGVVGYNSFFIRSGAFFSFDFDYKKLGLQTAGKIGTYFETGVCKKESPEFHTVINRKMVDKINLQVKE